MRLTEENISVFISLLVREGFTVTAETLGADVNQTNNYGETPLHVAALQDKLYVARLLLDKGAEVNWTNTYGRTPLHIAALNGQLDLAQLLIERGAELNHPMNDGRTPLYVAAQNGKVEVAKLLLHRGAKINQAKTNGATPLYIAAQNGKFAVAQLLIERGAEVNQATTSGAFEGETPLWVAVEEGQPAVAQLLLDNGAEVNQANTDGATPLYIAAEEGQLAVAQLLLNRGADVNQAKTDGATPLYIAAQQGHTTVTLLLKLAGAKRGAIDFDTNDEVIKQALKASAMLEIITQRFPESATDLRIAIETTLDNITNIDDLLSFNKGLERKFNKIIHPSSTADISHMVNQFLPGNKLPDALIEKIANPETENLAENDLRGTIKIVAQIVTDHLQQKAQRKAAERPQNLSHTAIVAERDAIRAKSKGPYGYSV